MLATLASPSTQQHTCSLALPLYLCPLLSTTLQTFILMSITFYHFADVYTYVHYLLPLCRCLYLCPLLSTTLQIFILMSITCYHFADVCTYVHYSLPLCRCVYLCPLLSTTLQMSCAVRSVTRLQQYLTMIGGLQ